MGRRRRPLGEDLRQLSTQMRALAAGQGGVIDARQCHALGAGDAAIRRLVGAGELRRSRRGIYRPAGLPPPDIDDTAHHARCAALLAAPARPAAVSHTSALRLLGLPLPPGGGDPRACITRRPAAATNDPLLGDVHVRDYQDADLVDVHGVPVLAGARLVLDCVEVMGPDSALAVADACLARQLTTRDELRAELHRQRRRSRRARAELVVARADPLAESWFESMSRWWLLEAGLPVPELQVWFGDHRVDLWFGEHRTVGEADGRGKYDEPGSLFAEKLREDRLRDHHGVEVVRWVPAEMRSAAGRREVVARFGRAFARRS
jgi:predicted transcriptional regulator of viral defense system